MSNITKVFIVLTAVLGMVLSVLSIASAAQWNNSKALVDKYYEQAVSETTQRINLEATMYASLAMKDDLIRQKDDEIAKLKTQGFDLSGEVARVKIDATRAEQERVAAEADRKKLQEILSVTSAQLTATQNRNTELQTQNNDFQTRLQQFVARVQELQSQLTVATDLQRNLQEKLAAAEQLAKNRGGAQHPAEETPEGVKAVAPPVAGPINGEISEVNGTYATLNIGETSGVVKGMVFMVYRGNTFVADVEIETVRPKEAGGRLKYSVQDVRPGDRVMYSSESASR